MIFIDPHGPKIPHFIVLFLRKFLIGDSFLLLVRSSSTENISIGDLDLSVSGGIERDPSSRGATGYSSSNVPMEAVSNKQRRDKMTNKGQQDEEEERGKIILLLSI